MRKICVVTSNRAEYGVMSRLITKIEQDPDLELQLVVTGAHLCKKYGMTINEISSTITKKIDIEIEKTPEHSIALAIEKFSKAFAELQPDLVLILGDRYEIMGVAIAAMLSNIPIAHLYGGESTQGAIDEAIRHSITKMSHIHFTSCDEYRNRVIQLGENPQNVFNVGALGVENIEQLKLLSKEELEKELNIKIKEKSILVTFHPETLTESSSREQFQEVLSALDELKDTQIIFTKPNSDAGNEDISTLIDNYAKTNSNAVAYTSLGALKYLSLVKFIKGVVGNSSSGIIEIPSFQKGTINIGDRQKGRIMAKSVINCKTEKDEISKAFDKLFSDEFQKQLNNVESPYRQEATSDKIITVIKNYSLNNILKKSFYDIQIN